MHYINKVIGSRIRDFRKGKGMTIEQLGLLVHKSKATVSKYEKGQISLDVPTLYAVSQALNISVVQLLHVESEKLDSSAGMKPSAFFDNSSRYYSYYFDGRNNQLVRCVIDMLDEAVNGRCRTMLYMNIKDFEHYHSCENTYMGYTEHYDTITRMSLRNQATPIEVFTINILAPFSESDTTWGLGSGVSFRPLMPIACKMLLSKVRLEENRSLTDRLRISKEDIRLMKIFNMFSVT
ncbi:MAG: transcriptional regulator [Clostridiales bacterium]|nr:MAG: transcriptional regulator [Clostridiales bacterium]